MKVSDGDTKPLYLRSKLSDGHTKPFVNTEVALLISLVNLTYDSFIIAVIRVS